MDKKILHQIIDEIFDGLTGIEVEEENVKTEPEPEPVKEHKIVVSYTRADEGSDASVKSFTDGDATDSKIAYALAYALARKMSDCVGGDVNADAMVAAFFKWFFVWILQEVSL